MVIDKIIVERERERVLKIIFLNSRIKSNKKEKGKQNIIFP